MKLNLPNKLTVLRMILIPICMIFIIYPVFGTEDRILWRIVAAAVFGLTALTDMIDGKIARKYNMITDFGKFLDPLADKLLIFGALIAILVRFGEDVLFTRIFVWAVIIVILRELAVTSLRMIASQKAGLVIAAAWLGKVKTTCQMICVLVLILEGALPFETHHIGGYVTGAVMVIMTVWSGLNYLRAYLPLLDPNK